LEYGEGNTRMITTRPLLALTACLIALALPVLGMQTGTGALDQFPEGHEARAGFAAAAAIF